MRNHIIISAIMILLLSKGSLASSHLFCTGVNYDAGDEPVSVCGGDFDEDGYPDLAVVNRLSEDVMIFLGLEGGRFSAYGVFPVGGDARFAIDGDFNEDGHIDLAVACYTDSIWVLLGAGDGTFVASTAYHVEYRPLALATGDFDTDGHTDIVVAREIAGSLPLLSGMGDGTFIAAGEIGVPHSIGSNSIITGYFDDDSNLDLAVGHRTFYYDPFEIIHGEVSVLLGRGNGLFYTRPMNELGENAEPWSIASADFNGDNHDDIAAVSWGRNELAILIGSDDGYFAPAARRRSEPIYPRSIVAEDFDGDEKIDLMIAGYIHDSFNISLYLGNGDGTFVLSRFYGAGDLPSSMITQDLNGDGFPDLAVANSKSGNLTVLEGNPEGGLRHPNLCDGGEDPYDVESADFNEDGIVDLAIAHSTYSGYVAIWLGEGDGTFTSKGSCAAGSRSSSVVTEDFDDDGHIDLAVTNWNSEDIHVYLGTGDGTFSFISSMASAARPYSIISGDYNEDGIADVATANSLSNVVSVYLGAGDGTFSSAVLYAAGEKTVSAVNGDFNEDGHIDVIAVNGTTSDVYLFLGVGDGTFASAGYIPVGSVPWQAVTGDFDENGHEDLAVANGGSNDVTVLLGSGDGTFLTATQYSAGKSPHGIAAGDFDDDGHIDLAVANWYSADITILIGRGDGTFFREYSEGDYSASGNPYALHACDLDGDGDIDLVSANRGIFDDGLAVMIFNRTADDVSTMLSEYSCAAEGEIVKIRWTLSKSIPLAQFRVYRAAGSSSYFQVLNAEIIQTSRASFMAVDFSCEPGVTYRYRVDMLDDEGSKTLFFSEDVAVVVPALALSQNYPNPFNPGTTIRYILPLKMHVTLSIIDVSGRRIARLIDSEMEAGVHSVEWAGCDADGDLMPSGVYFYMLNAGKMRVTRKMVLLR